MEKTKSFTELIVWQKAHQLALEVYKITQSFPKEEIYGINSQPIAANVAEGYKRKTQNDKARFFNISEGSLDEVKYYLILVSDLWFVENVKSLKTLADEVGKLLYSYKKAILTSKF